MIDYYLLHEIKEKTPEEKFKYIFCDDGYPGDDLILADVIQFGDNTTVVHWRGELNSTVVFDDWDKFIKVNVNKHKNRGLYTVNYEVKY